MVISWLWFYVMGICFIATGLNAYIAAELFLLQKSHIQQVLFYQRLCVSLFGIFGVVYFSEHSVPPIIGWWTLPLLPYLWLLFHEAKGLHHKRTAHLWYHISGTSDVVLNTCVITIRPMTGIVINIAGQFEKIFGASVMVLDDYESFYGFLRATACVSQHMDLELMITHLRQGTLVPAEEISLRSEQDTKDRWVRQTVGHVTNIYHETVAINLYYTSITHEKAIETELTLIRHALDNLPLGVVITDAERRIKFINKMELAYHEIDDPLEVIGRPSKFLGCEALRAMPPDIEKFEAHLTINTTLKKLIPKLFPCSLTSNYVEDDTGRTLGIVTICQPITPLTSSVTTEVLTIRDRIASVSQQTDVVIIILEPDGQIKLWNRYAHFLFGWSEEDAITNSHNVLNLVFGPSIATIEQMMEAKLAIEAQEISVWSKDGIEFRLSLTAHPLLTGEMAILGVLS